MIVAVFHVLATAFSRYRVYKLQFCTLSTSRGVATVSRPSVCLPVRDVDVPWAYVLGVVQN